MFSEGLNHNCLKFNNHRIFLKLFKFYKYILMIMSESLDVLINRIKELAETKQRGIAAIVGAAVADAATRPLHWVYNQTILDSILKATDTPEFFAESCSPFYTLELGECSSYNEAASVSLASLHSLNGKFDLEDIENKLISHFGPDTLFWECLSKRDNLPVDGPWIHVAVVKFIENFKTKKERPYGDDENEDTDAFCLSIPIIACFASQVDLWESLIHDVVTSLTTNKATVEVIHAQVLLLQAFVVGSEKPYDDVKEKIAKLYPSRMSIFEDVEKLLTENTAHKLQVSEIGKNCHLPGAFKSSYLAMLKTSSFVEAVRLNMKAGGCNCSRANIIGACFGAKYGIDGIPLEWLTKVKNIEQILKLAFDVFSSKT